MAINPWTVIAPRKRFTLHWVIHCGPDQEIGLEWALAVGTFDDRRTLLVRWNEDSPMGNPVSSGHPTWFVLPKDLHALALSVVQNQTNKSSAGRWLNYEDPTAWVKI
jgi:hypothetical protein